MQKKQRQLCILKQEGKIVIFTLVFDLPFPKETRITFFTLELTNLSIVPTCLYLVELQNTRYKCIK